MTVFTAIALLMVCAGAPLVHWRIHRDVENARMRRIWLTIELTIDALSWVRRQITLPCGCTVNAVTADGERIHEWELELLHDCKRCVS